MSHSSPIEIYAELSRKNFQKLCAGELVMQIPVGSSIRHKAGSRGFRIICADEEIAELVQDGLTNSGIPWQIN